MNECKAAISPVDASPRLISSSALTKTNAPFREAVAALMHLTTATRPEIEYAVGYVSRYMENPQEEHWVAVKRIFCYLQGSKGIEFAIVTRSIFVDILMRTGLEIWLTGSPLQAICSCYWARRSAGAARSNQVFCCRRVKQSTSHSV